MFLEEFEFGASAWLDRFDLVRRAGYEPAFPITGAVGLLRAGARTLPGDQRRKRRPGGMRDDFHVHESIPKCWNAFLMAGRFSGGHGSTRSSPCRLGAAPSGNP